MTRKALVDSILAMRLKPDHPAQHDEPETSAGDSCETSASTGFAADVQPASADELAGESTSSVVHAEVHSKHNDQPNQQKQEAKHDLSADDSGNMEESLEDIPMDEMLADPMHLAKVSCGPSTARSSTSNRVRSPRRDFTVSDTTTATWSISLQRRPTTNCASSAQASTRLPGIDAAARTDHAGQNS